MSSTDGDVAREIDEKKTRKALRRLARARREAEAGDTPDRKLSEWEDEFLDSVGERLNEFGSAFSDPDKGARDEALSARQSIKLREIEKKARGKARKPMSRGSGFKAKARPAPRGRDINEDLPDDATSSAPPAPLETKPGRPAFRVIRGGRDKHGE
ncbi:hypothetical protein [Maricaulis sp. CAU 1757]